MVRLTTQYRVKKFFVCFCMISVSIAKLSIQLYQAEYSYALKFTSSLSIILYQEEITILSKNNCHHFYNFHSVPLLFLSLYLSLSYSYVQKMYIYHCTTLFSRQASSIVKNVLRRGKGMCKFCNLILQHAELTWYILHRFCLGFLSIMYLLIKK